MSRHLAYALSCFNPSRFPLNQLTPIRLVSQSLFSVYLIHPRGFLGAATRRITSRRFRMSFMPYIIGQDKPFLYQCSGNLCQYIERACVYTKACDSSTLFLDVSLGALPLPTVSNVMLYCWWCLSWGELLVVFNPFPFCSHSNRCICHHLGVGGMGQGGLRG